MTQSEKRDDHESDVDLERQKMAPTFRQILVIAIAIGGILFAMGTFWPGSSSAQKDAPCTTPQCREVR